MQQFEIQFNPIINHYKQLYAQIFETSVIYTGNTITSQGTTLYYRLDKFNGTREIADDTIANGLADRIAWRVDFKGNYIEICKFISLQELKYAQELYLKGLLTKPSAPSAPSESPESYESLKEDVKKILQEIINHFANDTRFDLRRSGQDNEIIITDRTTTKGFTLTAKSWCKFSS